LGRDNSNETRWFDMTRCSGRECVQKNECLHYLESKKPLRKGKWIKASQCVFGIWSEDGEKLLKAPYAELLLKEQS